MEKEGSSGPGLYFFAFNQIESCHSFAHHIFVEDRNGLLIYVGDDCLFSSAEEVVTCSPGGNVNVVQRGF